MNENFEYVPKLTLDPAAAALFAKVAAAAGRTTEQVLADALFQLAGALSLEAITEKTGTFRKS